MNKVTLDALLPHLSGKRVLVRVDFNVPLTHDGKTSVADDTRLRGALPTIEALRKAGARTILMSHLGRPKGKPSPEFSLKPVAEHLEKLLGAPVRMASASIGDSAAEIDQMENGDVLLLENTRFLPGETANDDALAKVLAGYADAYVNDAFGAAHRAHASTEGVAHHVKTAAMGFLLEKEIRYLSQLLEAPASPFVAVLGGAKVSDKIGLIENLLDRVDRVLIGGAMSYTFLKALGRDVGDSRVEEDKLGEAKRLFDRADGKIVLPVDHVAARKFSNDAESKIVDQAIDEGWMGLDIGPETVSAYRELLMEARTIVWNGPMGVFEMSNFNKGTFAIAETLAKATRENDAMTVVGGGDSVAAIVKAGFEDEVTHVSTGGGAMLEYLEGKVLPGIAALSDA